MVFGFLSVLFIHIWENVGMTLGLMPVTGIPLPFVSYGGTFQMVNLAMIGLCLSVRYHRYGTHGVIHLPSFMTAIADRIDAFRDRQWEAERLKRWR